MIEGLVAKMATHKSNFQEFVLQLQMVVQTAARIRRALEDSDVQQVEAALDDAESAGVSTYVLPMGIVQVGFDMIQQKEIHQTYIKDRGAKLSKLVHGQGDTLKAQKALAVAQAKCVAEKTMHNDKAKKVLLGLAGGNAAVLVKKTFTAWQKVAKQQMEEHDIYLEYKEPILKAQVALKEAQVKHLTVVDSTLSRLTSEVDTLLLQTCFRAYATLVKEFKDSAEDGEEIKVLTEQIQALTAKKLELARAVMSRLLKSHEDALLITAWQAWKGHYELFLRDKEVENAVVAVQRKLEALNKDKMEKARKTMSKMCANSESAMLSHIFKAWAELTFEVLAHQEMNECLEESKQKAVDMQGRAGAVAMLALGKAAKHTEHTMVMRCFYKWRVHSKMESIAHAHSSRIEGKRQQLQNVQKMFRNFAEKLEVGIGTVPDSGRDIRDGPKRLSKQGGSVSLPDIKEGPMMCKQGSVPASPADLSKKRALGHQDRDRSGHGSVRSHRSDEKDHDKLGGKCYDNLKTDKSSEYRSDTTSMPAMPRRRRHHH